MTLDQFKYIYFLGIGGIGMSALARWFGVNGYSVAGYDKTPSVLTDALEAEGMAIHFTEDVDQIPAMFRDNPAETLVIYTPAVPKTHAEYIYLTEKGFVLQKRSQVLGLLAGQMKTVAVAGTHGKTTTSSMVAHILRHAGMNCAAFLGGITNNYGTNFLLNEPADDLKSVVCVVEADEFDRSFLTLFPQIAVVTSTDADHLDIYGAHEAVLESFGLFVSQIDSEGVLLMKQGLSLAEKTKATVQTYSLNEGDFHSRQLKIEDATFVFDLVYESGVICDIKLTVPGFHNVENAVVAGAVALELGVSPEAIRLALNSYRGVRRRFEYVLKTDQAVLIDDYAHHPTEVMAFLSSVKALYPDRELTAIFQPHLFSRTRDFAEGFAESLSIADHVLLLDIYPARELPMEGVTSDLIFQDVRSKTKKQCTKAELTDVVRRMKPSLLVTIGAGDIDKLLPTLKTVLEDQ
ncbi:UDP-N-acetylmuramate--L-alanine ligase [Spirosoma utsteinense]|uniref:UDP-N-acetylmuramate--L-alanine ligase n=1 Tax=Spirosoma utsteinense TaxID=2585773 RepID=A0ABR6W6U6_9BACT|nr:UDP-N-acetylmuramate--L-alanine ligase [Spirosoma utsteinense]MBC3786110.1 UDP-N-acetylmuramate--alanine ligase [Spirosoma utsteinense]MBC3792299.1 UDP-N-acetylmuramate--alanine ligase [Spirosoma utsteinense]